MVFIATCDDAGASAALCEMKNEFDGKIVNGI